MFVPLSGIGQDTIQISGHVIDEIGHGISDVEIGNTTTNDNGYYFVDTTSNEYSYSLSKEQNPLNGISINDVILIGKHIIGVVPLDNPYRYIAADFNENGTISTLDMVLIRKLLLNQDIGFTRKGWRFISRQFIFPDPQNPFISTFPNIFTINTPSIITDNDFIGLKKGDASGNAAPNLLISPEDRNTETPVAWETEDINLTAGQITEIILRQSEAASISGYQFSLKFDPSQIEILEAVNTQDGLEKSFTNINQANKGWLHFIGYELEGKQLDAKNAMIKIKLRSKSDGLLSQALEMSPSHIDPTINTGDASYPLILQFEKTKNSQHLCFPNPFKETTKLRFFLENKGNVKLNISDINGRLISTQTRYLNKGNQEWDIFKNDLNEGQLFFYQLESPDFNFTGKIMRIE